MHRKAAISAKGTSYLVSLSWQGVSREFSDVVLTFKALEDACAFVQRFLSAPHDAAEVQIHPGFYLELN